MLIKVCGITQEEQLRELDELKSVDLIGTIYYEKSKRYVRSVLPATNHSNKVGVFVNESCENILNISAEHSIDLVQLHGNETPIACKRLSEKLKVIKAFGLSDSFDFKTLEKYQDKVDFFLFDTLSPEYGGSGRKFDWSIIDQYYLSTPFLLSGGIRFSDAKELRSIKHPQFYGIDINSGFETQPGIKNIELIKHFIDELNNE